MITLLYQLTRKGWLKALSFLLASAFFALILFKSSHFAHYFGGHIPYLVLLTFYAMVILWIHGIGFEIRSKLWKLLFLPLLGYLILIPAFVFLMIAK